jgi:hypothetical protein
MPLVLSQTAVGLSEYCARYCPQAQKSPMARVKFDPGEGEEREDFTPEERTRILTMARDAEPQIYWCSWLCSFLGTLADEDDTPVVYRLSKCRTIILSRQPTK